MLFLRRFCSFFQSKNNLPHPPSDNEPIDRVIFSSKFIKKNNKVHSNAFIPTKRLDLSVYRVQGLARKQVWDLVAKYIEKKRTDKKMAKAIAEIKISDVSKHKTLKLNPDGKPHFRHMNIECFPNSKSDARMIALEMAESAKLIMKE